ncbi:hypothetical protein HMPREF9999_00532 [Alloprevotella sp. oral taxon 473 str. F0040]|nr:hypothetical protein HMPREF9999_00532 [Alloprevotella sp. oral taxon 473 str. F0040]
MLWGSMPPKRGENVYRHFYISEKSPRVRVRTSGSCDFLLSQPSQK